MKINDGLEIGGNGLMYFLTAIQPKEMFQIISLVLSILISVIIIIEKVVKWYKDAKSDGKITKEEIKELKNEINDDVKKIEEDANEIVQVVEEIEKGE